MCFLPQVLAGLLHLGNLSFKEDEEDEDIVCVHSSAGTSLVRGLLGGSGLEEAPKSRRYLTAPLHCGVRERERERE